MQKYINKSSKIHIQKGSVSKWCPSAIVYDNYLRFLFLGYASDHFLNFVAIPGATSNKINNTTIFYYLNYGGR